MKNLTTTLTLSLVSSLAIANIAQASPVDMNRLEAEMNSCGYLDDANAMYSRCLQINHPNHQDGSYERWNARGSICTELVQKHGAPVSYRQDIVNNTDSELANSSCIDDYYYFTDEFTQLLEAEMNACDYLDDADAMYSRCLQINHPDHQNGSYERWNARGSICTELVQKHGAPVSYRQDIVNNTDSELANSSCIDDYYYLTDEFTREVAEEMGSCELLTDRDTVYTNCLQVNHPQFHGGDSTRWDMRGKICTNVANKYNAPVSYLQDAANAAYQKLATSDCYDLDLMDELAQKGKPFESGQAVHIKSKAFGTHFTNTNGDLRVEDANSAPTAIQLIKVNGDGALKFGDLIALRFEDGSFVTAMNSSENFNAVARAPHLDQWEVFKIVDTNGASSGHKITSDSTFALVSTHGKYFSATPQGEVKAQVHHIQAWEHFQISHLSQRSRNLINIDIDYGSTSGTYNEGDVVGAYAGAGASVEFGTEFEIGEGIVLSSTIGAGAEAEANVCAGLNPSECAGVYAQAQASAGIYAGNELDIDSDAGKINVCAESMAEVGASAEGGAVINGDGATAGGGFEAGATVGSEACAGITGQYGNIGGKAGVTVGPSVSAGMQMSFNFDGCTWSTSVEGELHILVGVDFGADGGVNFCHVGEEVAELATDLWYDVMEGEVVEEWTVGAAEDVAQWTVGAANDMADWTEGAANDAGKWTVGAANDVADWTEGAANDVADWTEGAAYDVADWTSGAAYDVADWTVGAANDVADVAVDFANGVADVAEDAWDATKGAVSSIASLFGF